MKKLWKYWVLLCILVMISTYTSAQSKRQLQETDSLKTLLQTSLSDSSQVEVLNELAWIYRNNDYKTSLSYGTKAKELALKIGYKRGLATAYNRIGVIHKNRGEYKQALEVYQKALKIEQETNHWYGISRAKNQIGVVFKKQRMYKKAIAYFGESIEALKKGEDFNPIKIATKKINLAVCYRSLGDTEKAIQFYLDAVDIYKKNSNKDRDNQIGKCYLGLGTLYRNANNLKISRKYYLKALSLFETRNNKTSLIKTYNQLGILYLIIKDYEASLDYYQKALRLKQELGTTQNVQMIYNNLGLAYLKQSKLDSAKKFLKLSLELSHKKKDKLGLASAYNNLGLVSKQEQNYSEAIAHFKKSLKFSNDISEKYNRKNVLENLSNTYSEMKKYEKAFKYLSEYNNARDSLETSFREAMAYKEIYEKEKKMSELLEKDRKIKDGKLFLQTVLNYFFGVGLLLSLIIVFAIVRNYQERRKVRQSKQKIDNLMREQEFLVLSKMLEGQEVERNRIAQDLHDRLGGMLSVVKLQFVALKESLGLSNTEDTTMLQETGQLIDNACDAVRQVSHNLSARSLERFGLISALNDLKENIDATGTLDIDVIDVGFDNRRIPIKYETQIYRIIQELISNVLKHANATIIEIQIFWDDKGDNLYISVEDDGRGFNIDRLDQEKALGMEGIQTRVKALSGVCMIDSDEGKGTMVMIDIPLELGDLKELAN